MNGLSFDRRDPVRTIVQRATPTWSLSYLASFALLCALLSGAARAECARGYAVPLDLPTLLPDPAYVSPNDEDEPYTGMIARGYEPAPWLESLTNAAESAAYIRRSISRWDTSLRTAESIHWTHYDQNGQFDPVKAKEFAYWLQKRERWAAVLTNLSFAATNAGASGASLLAALRLLLDSNGSRDFSVPAAVQESKMWPVSAKQSVLNRDERYAGYFQKLLQHSFLINSRCSPRHSPDAIDKLYYYIIYPTLSPSSADPILANLKTWASEPGNSPEEVLETIERESLAAGHSTISARQFILDRLSGKELVDPMYEEFLVRTQVTLVDRNFKAHYYDQFDGTIMPIYQMHGRMEHGKPYRLDLAPMSAKDAYACAVASWSDIQKFIFDTNRNVAVTRARSNGVESRNLRSAMVAIGAIECAKPEGRDHPLVLEFLKRERLVEG